jgi:hypothetical protein
LVLSTLEGLGVLAALLTDSPLPQGGWLVGFSRARIAILGIALGSTTVCAVMAWKSLADSNWSNAAATAWTSWATQRRSFRLFVIASTYPCSSISSF